MDYAACRILWCFSLLCPGTVSVVLLQSCTRQLVDRSLLVNCSQLNLSHMPTDLNGTNVTKLDLSVNNIMYLKASDLQTFNALEWLNISHNNLLILHNDSFIHIASTLTCLDLSYNYFSELPDNAFTPLSKVVTLLLEKPGIPESKKISSLGPGFQNLTQLQNFSLTRIYIRNFNATFLGNVVSTNLISADFSFNTFARTGNDTFHGFYSLEHLTMHNVRGLTEPALSRIMLSLNNSSLKTLNLGGNEELGGLRTTTFSGLANTPLENLDVSNSVVRSIEDYAFRSVGGLTHLQLNNMKLDKVSRYGFRGLTNISSLDLRNNKLASLGTFLNNMTTLKHLTLESNPVQHIGPETFYGLHSLKFLCLCKTKVKYLPNNTFLPLRNMQKLCMDNLHVENTEQLLVIEAGAFRGTGKMRVLSMNNARICNLSADHVRPMENLEHISLDHNPLITLDPLVMKPANSTLRVISLSQTGITSHMLEEGLLNGLPKLTTLYLRDNGLQYLPDNAFEGDTSLYKIDLQHNTFHHIPHAIKVMPKIRILNMYQNLIATVGADDVRYLRSSGLHKYMAASNPYNCNCDLLPFLDWFKDTNITLEDRNFYRCASPRQLNKQALSTFNPGWCNVSDYLPVQIALPVAFVLVIATTLCLVYHYRLQIKWLWYLHRLEHYQKLEEEDDQEYEYSAFVSYAGDDYKFVLEKMMPILERPDEEGVEPLRLAVEFRDFPAGCDISQTVIEFIEKSRKTVLLISQHSVQNQNDWLWYVYRQAAFRAPGRKNLLIIILLEPDVQKERNLPKSLRQELKNRMYIAWPGDNAKDGDKTLFWRQLREALKTPRRISVTNMD